MHTPHTLSHSAQSVAFVDAQKMQIFTYIFCGLFHEFHDVFVSRVQREVLKKNIKSNVFLIIIMISKTINTTAS